MNFRRAIIIGGAFAALWWIIGVTASGNASVLLCGIPLLITAVLVVAALRRGVEILPLPPKERARQGRLIGITSGAEGLLILVGVYVLANIDKRNFTVSVVAIIVGLHFLPLARWLPARRYYVTSALLIGLGTAGCFVPGANQRLLAVSLGAACVLWLTCVLTLRGANAERQPT
jgi:hypothetical protein